MATTKKSTAAKKSTATKKSSSTAKKSSKTAAHRTAKNKKDAASAINQITDILGKNPRLLSQFKNDPSGAIGSILSNVDATDDTKQSVTAAVSDHGNGADLTSVLGSLAGLFGSSQGSAEQAHADNGNPLNALGGLLGLGGNTAGGDNKTAQTIETIGAVINIVGTLSSVFGNKGNSKKKKDDGGIFGTLGKLFGG